MAKVLSEQRSNIDLRSVLSSGALGANLTWVQGWRAALLPPDQEGARRSLARLPGTVPAVRLALPQPHSARWPRGQACLGLSQVTPWH